MYEIPLQTRNNINETGSMDDNVHASGLGMFEAHVRVAASFMVFACLWLLSIVLQNAAFHLDVSRLFEIYAQCSNVLTHVQLREHIRKIHLNPLGGSRELRAPRSH